MCNIAGYVGNKQAAPILIEMMRSQEGLDAGCYTGMATIDNGKIYYVKVVGDLEQLLQRTDAASLPGTIGIIHSRTPGDTGDTWAHPFVCDREGEVKTALVANGGADCYLETIPISHYADICQSLLDEGFTMQSRMPSDGKQLTLPDGSRVHITDGFCQLISKKVLQGTDAVSAMMEACQEYRIEIATLMLSTAQPDAIVWARSNFPMHLGQTIHGSYLATAPQCFPEDAQIPYLLPPMAVGTVRGDGFTCRHFPEPLATMAPVLPSLWAEAYDVICRALSEGPKNVPELEAIVEPLFEQAQCLQINTVVYMVLYDLQRQNRLVMEERRKPGTYPHLTAPVCYIQLKTADKK